MRAAVLGSQVRLLSDTQLTPKDHFSMSLPQGPPPRMACLARAVYNCFFCSNAPRRQQTALVEPNRYFSASGSSKTVSMTVLTVDHVTDFFSSPKAIKNTRTSDSSSPPASSLFSFPLARQYGTNFIFSQLEPSINPY